MLTISPSSNEDGEVTHFIGIQNDLTEFRLLEDKFHQSQKMEAIGPLVGGIAHDFNNMLAGITGNLYLVRGKLKDYPELVTRLSDVDRICFQAADMISQLLAFARRGQINLQSLSLTSFVKEALKLVEVSIPEDIRLTQDICADDLVVLGDITQLQQIILNLVNNARDALEGMIAPEIKVALSLYKPGKAFGQQHEDRELADQYAHLSVSDNGCGIPHAEQQRIFEPFYTTKEQGKGTGLGLAMVFGAVQTHHGMVEVESEVGHGSTLHIYLPLQQQVRSQFDLAPTQETLTGEGETILLADDEFQVREVTGEVLEELGYRVLLAADGVEAVALFAEHHDYIALTILDVVMPAMGGREAADKIRAMDASAAILFATGYDQARVLDDKIITSDHCGVINKPYAVDKLSRVIRDMIA